MRKEEGMSVPAHLTGSVLSLDAVGPQGSKSQKQLRESYSAQ